ncbi:MAG: type I restriction enzyme HsdR N-terminal domain-containing protein [Chloroflexota bacterium]
MPPRKFYDIDPACYLFVKQDTPEEKVRQWALFELLSTYGFNIQNIQVEVPVKMGSKNYRADIVIKLDGFPGIVVECKEEAVTDIEGAIKQAISYANFLQATFVLFTNGNLWVAKRKLNDEWFAIADIPNRIKIETNKTITSTLWFIQNIEPVLYWTYQAIPKEYAREYFSWFTEFYRSEVFSEDLDFELYYGVDNLLRILGSNSAQGKFEVAEYDMEKITVAYNNCGKYFDKLGIRHPFNDYDLRGYNFRDILGGIKFGFSELVNAHKELSFKNALLIRMANSIAKYLWQTFESGKYQNVPPNISSEIETFINEIVVSKIGVRVPNSLEADLSEEMRMLCSSKWENHFRSNHEQPQIH